VVLDPVDGDPIWRRSAANLDSVEHLSIAMLVERVGRLSQDRTRELCSALEAAVDCDG
jgi:mRNA interferase MazF